MSDAIEPEPPGPYSGPVLDAGIFPGVPETYTCHLPHFFVADNDRDPLMSGKFEFIWDFSRKAWVWNNKRRA